MTEIKLKINIVFPYNMVGGAFRSTYELSNRLTKRGHDIKIYYPLIPYIEHHKYLSYSGIKFFLRGLVRNIIRGGRINWLNTEFKTQSVPLINKFFIRDADIIIANHWPTAPSVYKLPSSKGEKYFFIRDIEQWADYYQDEIKSFQLDMKRLVVSSWIKDHLNDELGLSTTEVINNGLNFDLFGFKDKKYHEDKIQISFLYSSHPMKGGKSGLEVLEKIYSKFPFIDIVIFGFEKPLNLNTNFKYISKPTGDRLKKIYIDSDIFLWTSEQEGWGNPPLEAMAAKSCVVATNTGSVRQIIIDDYNGYVVDPLSLYGIEDKICNLIKSKERRKEISINAYNDIQKYSWDASTDILENLLVNDFYKKA